jgi:hypothetical protein
MYTVTMPALPNASAPRKNVLDIHFQVGRCAVQGHAMKSLHLVINEAEK